MKKMKNYFKYVIFILFFIISNSIFSESIYSEKYIEAISLFEKSESPEVIEKFINMHNFKNFEHIYLTGILKFYKKNYNEAVIEFKTLLKSNDLPKEIEYKATNFLHISYLKTNNYLSSIEVVRNFVENNSDWKNKHYQVIIKNYFEFMLDNDLNREYIDFIRKNLDKIKIIFEFNLYLGRYYFLLNDFKKACEIFEKISKDSRSIVYNNICNSLINNDSECHILNGISYTEPNSDKSRCLYNAVGSVLDYNKIFYARDKLYSASISKNNWLNVIDCLNENKEISLYIGKIDFDILQYFIQNNIPILLPVDIDENVFSTDHIIVAYGKKSKDLYAVAGLQNTHIEFINFDTLNSIWNKEAIIIVPKANEKIIYEKLSKEKILYSKNIVEKFSLLSLLILKNNFNNLNQCLKEIENYIEVTNNFIFNYPDFLYILIQAYENINDKKLVKKNYETILSLHYDKKNLYSLYGQFLFDNKDYKEAKYAFLQSIEFGSNKANNHLFLSMIYFDEKDYLNSEKYLKIAEELNTNSNMVDLIKKMKTEIENKKYEK